MHERQHFKAGFLRSCAQQGLTGEEMLKLAQLGLARLEAAEQQQEKEAFFGQALGSGAKALGGRALSLLGIPLNWLQHAGQRAIDTTMDVAGTTAKTMGAGMILAPLGLASLAGAGAASMRNMDDVDPKEEQKLELTEELQRNAELARLQTEEARRRRKRDARLQTTGRRLL